MSGALESMTLASRRYAEFAFGRAADPEISNLLGRARRLAEAPALLIMELSGLHDAGRLSRSDFGACLELIVSYLMRRAAGGLQTRGYWSIFARLAYELDGGGAARLSGDGDGDASSNLPVPERRRVRGRAA